MLPQPSLCLKVAFVWILMAIRSRDLPSVIHASDSCSAIFIALIHGYLMFPAFHAAKCNVTSVHVNVPAIAQTTVTETASVEEMGGFYGALNGITVTSCNSGPRMKNRENWNLLGFDSKICRSKLWHACSAIHGYWKPRILFSLYSPRSRQVWSSSGRVQLKQKTTKNQYVITCVNCHGYIQDW